QTSAGLDAEEAAVERPPRLDRPVDGFLFSAENERLRTSRDPAGAGGERTRHEPRVCAAIDVLDRPSERLILDAAPLLAIESLGVEDVVAGEIGKDDASGMMTDDEVLQDTQLLLGAEA